MEVNTKHSDVILDKLNRERNSNKKYCDFTLNVGTQDFSVHKCVLGAFSDFFDKMFTSEMRERYENKANMEGISAAIMGLILTFIYTSCITINNGNVFELLFAAEYLQIKSLKEICTKFFRNCLDSENCLRIRSCCRQYNIKDVAEKADGFIAENIISVVKSEEFCDITLDDVTNILKLKSDKGSNEESKYNGLIAWIKRDVSERTKNFTKLFSLINLHLLSKEFMNDVMMKEKLVFSSVDCLQSLIKVTLSSVPSTSTSKPADGASEHRSPNSALANLPQLGKQSRAHAHSTSTNEIAASMRTLEAGAAGTQSRLSQQRSQRNRPVPGGSRPKPKALSKCKALYTYEAQDTDEISFDCGAIIEIVKEDPSGWWTGRLNNREGLFPGNYVEKI